MEADWSVALAVDDPMIVVPWAGPEGDSGTCRFIDLRLSPDLIDAIAEAESGPLRSALLRLNDGASHLWTAKCDAWTTSAEPFDPYEMDAEPGETAYGTGSYIDLLPRDAGVRSCFAQQERWMRRVTERLRATPARAVRVELVLRAAEVQGAACFGITWFVEGCGGTAQSAREGWGNALGVALAVLLTTPFDASFEAGAGDDTMGETGE
jgi:hypothetical protein